jgi:hypothetical protein
VGRLPRVRRGGGGDPVGAGVGAAESAAVLEAATAVTTKTVPAGTDGGGTPRRAERAVKTIR